MSRKLSSANGRIGDAVLGNTPCASSIEECQAFVYQNQLNCFLGTCDVVVMVASPPSKARR
jgi:hypothetical protein